MNKSGGGGRGKGSPAAPVRYEGGEEFIGHLTAIHSVDESKFEVHSTCEIFNFNHLPCSEGA